MYYFEQRVRGKAVITMIGYGRTEMPGQTKHAGGIASTILMEDNEGEFVERRWDVAVPCRGGLVARRPRREKWSGDVVGGRGRGGAALGGIAERASIIGGERERRGTYLVACAVRGASLVLWSYSASREREREGGRKEEAERSR